MKFTLSWLKDHLDTDASLDKIVETLTLIGLEVEGVEDPVYLFGSRVDDRARGGDIDILVFSREDPFTLARRIAVRFFMACEAKLDVLVLPPDHRTPSQQAFLASLRLERLA